MTCKTVKSSGAARLADFIEAVRHRPFEWGVHDCLHFPLRAVEAQTGIWHAPPAYASPKEALRHARHINIVTEFDTRFRRCPHVPPAGSLVVTPTDDGLNWRGGVVVSDRAAYVSPSGLVFARLRPDIELYWTVT